MSTINTKHIIDELIAADGYYEDDPRAAFIVEYTTPEGQTTWGVTWSNESHERQRRYLVESPFILSPRVLWVAKKPS